MTRQGWELQVVVREKEEQGVLSGDRSLRKSSKEMMFMLGNVSQW